MWDERRGERGGKGDVYVLVVHVAVHVFVLVFSLTIVYVCVFDMG